MASVPAVALQHFLIGIATHNVEGRIRNSFMDPGHQPIDNTDDRLDIGGVIHLPGEDDQGIGKNRMEFLELRSRVIKNRVDAVPQRGDIGYSASLPKKRSFSFSRSSTLFV